MNNEFQIEILHRGEDLSYQENGEDFRFGLQIHNNKIEIETYKCSDAKGRRRHLTSIEEKRIITRIVDYFRARGEICELLTESPAWHLMSAEEIIQKRRLSNNS